MVTATINPHVASGAALLDGARIIDLLDRVDAGDTPKDVAQDFRVPLSDLLEVLTPAWRELVERLEPR